MKTLKKIGRVVLYVIAALVLAWIIFVLATPPRTDRDWNLDQAVLPDISIDGDVVSIKNIRNFDYRTTTDYTPAYYDRTINVRNIEKVWYMVEPFSGNSGAAHTLLSFGLNDGSYISVSVEIRKEKGESFSPVKGLLRQYELMYVIADERDVIRLRSNYRHDQVFLYPIKADKEKVQSLFLGMLERAKKLQEDPEYYNTLTSTCTTNIVRHINDLVPGRVPYDFRTLLPAHSDALAYELGLIDTDLTFEEARLKYNINERAETYGDSLEFSKKIRE